MSARAKTVPIDDELHARLVVLSRQTGLRLQVAVNQVLALHLGEYEADPVALSRAVIEQAAAAADQAPTRPKVVKPADTGAA